MKHAQTQRLKWSWCFSVVAFLAFSIVSAPVAAQSSTPVIGILSQPLGETVNTTNSTHYVIAASYVKWLEAAGARSIPIPYDAGPALVDDIFKQINGLLLPGGASEVPPSVYQLVKLAQDASSSSMDFFPVWGTCLGFEYLVKILSQDSSGQIVADGFDAENVSLPLLNVVRRELYQDDRIFDIVTKYNVTMNSHFKGVDPYAFMQNEQLDKLFHITSINRDGKGRLFVSTIEPRNSSVFPFYGTQFHAEKNAFEYGTYRGTNIPYKAVDHSDQAVEFSNYMARFFVRKIRENPNNRVAHSYTKLSEYPLVHEYPMKRGRAFEQYYVIPSAKTWSQESTVQERARQLRSRL